MFVRRIAVAAATITLFTACESETTNVIADDVARFSLQDDAALNRDLAQIRAGTARFHDVNVALAEGYAPVSECVAVPGAGGMGYHYMKFPLVLDAGFSPPEPEALLYAPRPDGSLELVGVEYLVVQGAWHGAGNAAPPSFGGATFAPMAALGPNPAMYALHAWVWRPNPAGTFAPFNAKVECGGAETHNH